MNDPLSVKLGFLNNELKTIKERDDFPEWGTSLFYSIFNVLDEINTKLMWKSAEATQNAELVDAKIKTQETVINVLCDEKTRLNTLVNKLQIDADDQANYSRRNQLLIHGIDEEIGGNNKENSTLKVINLFSEKLGIVNLSPKDIDRSHRIG